MISNHIAHPSMSQCISRDIQIRQNNPENIPHDNIQKYVLLSNDGVKWP